MRKISVALLTAVFAVTFAYAESNLDGRSIVVEFGKYAAHYDPVSIAYDGPAPQGNLAAVDQGTGKAYPVTVRDGQLVFVPEGAAPHAKKTYTLKATQADGHVSVKPEEGKKEISVVIDNKPFTTYHYSDEYQKSFLWPVLSDGVPVTRAWPMGERELSRDHKHHKSWWVSYGNLNGVDCWGEEKGSGWQVTKSVSYSSGGAYGWIAADDVWTDKDKKPVINESREYRFYNTPTGERVTDMKVTFTAAYGDVKWGDTKEGGICAFRVRDIMTVNKGGTITLSNGRDKDTWGKRSPWCDYSGNLGKKEGVHGIAVFDNHQNLRFPTWWHVRKYGLMAANCFGLSYFTEDDPEPLNGDYMMKKGDTLTFHYRVYIHDGDVKQADVLAHYENYAQPPKATWGAAQ